MRRVVFALLLSSCTNQSVLDEQAPPTPTSPGPAIEPSDAPSTPPSESAADASSSSGDASLPDGGGPLPPFARLAADQRSTRDCTLDPPLEGAIARYDFESLSDNLVEDSLGMHHGMLEGQHVELVDGPEGCGQALRLTSENDDSLVRVSDHPAFREGIGSVDLWYRTPDSRTDEAGLVWRRRADGSEHFLVMKPRRATVMLAFRGPIRFELESRDLEPGRWVHVGVNLGPPVLELYVDGELMRDGEPGLLTSGLIDFDGDWVFGAGWTFEGDEPAQVTHLRRSAIDAVRISSLRRDFTR